MERPWSGNCPAFELGTGSGDGFGPVRAPIYTERLRCRRRSSTPSVYGRPAERSCRRASEPNRDPGDNTYGKNSEERDLILGHLVEVEPLLRATCTHEVDATQPLRRGRSAARCHRTRGRRSMNSESGPFQANAALVLESFDAFNAGDTER